MENLKTLLTEEQIAQAMSKTSTSDVETTKLKEEINKINEKIAQENNEFIRSF